MIFQGIPWKIKQKTKSNWAYDNKPKTITEQKIKNWTYILKNLFNCTYVQTTLTYVRQAKERNARAWNQNLYVRCDTWLHAYGDERLRRTRLKWTIIRTEYRRNAAQLIKIWLKLLSIESKWILYVTTLTSTHNICLKLKTKQLQSPPIFWTKWISRYLLVCSELFEDWNSEISWKSQAHWPQKKRPTTHIVNMTNFLKWILMKICGFWIDTKICFLSISVVCIIL